MVPPKDTGGRCPSSSLRCVKAPNECLGRCCCCTGIPLNYLILVEVVKGDEGLSLQKKHNISRVRLRRRHTEVLSHTSENLLFQDF